MASRARNIVSGEVVNKFTANPKHLYVITINTRVLKNQEENIVMACRKTMDGIRSDHDIEFYNTIFKTGNGNNVWYFTTLLTQMWLWSRVEEYLKFSYWYKHYLWILTKKGYKFDLEVDEWDPEAAETPGQILKEENKQ